MSLINRETSSREQKMVIEEVSSEGRKAMPIQDREVVTRMIQGTLREDQVSLLQQADSPERLLSILERLGRETPINLTDTGNSTAMRFKDAKVYLKGGGEWHEQGAPVSPASLKGTTLWGLLEGALAGEGTICAGI